MSILIFEKGNLKLMIQTQREKETNNKNRKLNVGRMFCVLEYKRI